jgi:hypothetical protein
LGKPGHIGQFDDLPFWRSTQDILDAKGCADNRWHGFGLGKQLSIASQCNTIGAWHCLSFRDLAGRKNSKRDNIDVINLYLLREGGR